MLEYLWQAWIRLKWFLFGVLCTVVVCVYAYRMYATDAKEQLAYLAAAAYADCPRVSECQNLVVWATHNQAEKRGTSIVEAAEHVYPAMREGKERLRWTRDPVFTLGFAKDKKRRVSAILTATNYIQGALTVPKELECVAYYTAHWPASDAADRRWMERTLRHVKTIDGVKFYCPR